MRGFFYHESGSNSPQNARNAPFLKIFLGGGGIPPNPLTKARSFAARDMPLRGMYIQIPEILKLGPPLRNPAYAPVSLTDKTQPKYDIKIRLVKKYKTYQKNIGPPIKYKTL